MSDQILVPMLGESVTEATVSKWLKSEGEEVIVDEPIVELETDKVNVEVPAPTNGKLEKISVKEGETVNVGTLLGSIGESNTSSKAEVTGNEYSPPQKKINKIEQTSELSKAKPKEEKKIIKKDSEVPLILTELYDQLEIEKSVIPTVSPAARKIVADKKIDITSIEGSGRNGIILKEDLIDLMGDKPEPLKRKISHGPEERIKMTRLRMTIAKRLKEAQENAAMLTTFNEVDMHEIISMKNDYKLEFQKKYSVKLGFMSFFVKACVLGLKNYPIVNAEIQDDEIVYKNYYNISIAVGTDRGLVVPVLRDAEEMSFADIEKKYPYLGKKLKMVKLVLMIFKEELLQ